MKGKKITAILLTTALAFTCVTGCGAKPQTPAAPSANAENTDGAAQDTQTEAPADNSAETTDKTIGLLVPATVGDPFIALSIKGLDRLAEEQGATLRTVETLDSAEYEDQVRAMADMGANPVYLMWGDLSEIALRLAPEYPDTGLCNKTSNF